MLAAIAIVYLILVITFGGGLAPFAVLFSLPFTVIGALVGLLIAGETISVSSMIGVLMLIGIVVTNAIVLIDRVINMEKEGLSTREAILEAGYDKTPSNPDDGTCDNWRTYSVSNWRRRKRTYLQRSRRYGYRWINEFNITHTDLRTYCL